MREETPRFGSAEVWNSLEQAQRNWLGKLADEFVPFSGDGDQFASEAIRHPQHRFAEAYAFRIACRCGRDLGFLPKKASADGADIVLADAKPAELQFEVVVPDLGGSENAPPRVQLRESGNVWTVDRRRVALRITNSMANKVKQHQSRLQREPALAHAPYVVVVGGAILRDVVHDQGPIPMIASGLFGLLTPTLEVGLNGQGTEEQIASQSMVAKSPQAMVDAAVFRDPANARISGVLFFWRNAFDLLPNEDFTFGEITYVANPLATKPIPVGFFRNARTCSLENGQLRIEGPDPGISNDPT